MNTDPWEPPEVTRMERRPGCADESTRVDGTTT